MCGRQVILAFLLGLLLILSVRPAPLQEGFETVEVVGWLGTFRASDMYFDAVDKIYDATTKQLLWDTTMNPPEPTNPIYNTKKPLILLFTMPQRIERAAAEAIDPTTPVKTIVRDAAGYRTLVDGELVLGPDGGVTGFDVQSASTGTISAPTSSTSGSEPPKPPGGDTWIDYVLIGFAVLIIVLLIGSAIQN